MDDMIAIDDAATELGVSRGTVWAWIRRYEVPTFRRLGERRTLLRRADVAKLKEPVPVEELKKGAA